jgi:hypothetical protein
MPDLRIVFLFLLLVTGVLYVLRVGRTFAPGTLKDMILDVILVPAALGTGGSGGAIGRHQRARRQ